MAAALVRRGATLCCIRRELCRVVWRPQAALFSSKPADRKQPRRTHIRKEKPQPAVDVTKLLERIFSQRRPGTAPPAAKCQTAQVSSISTKPPATSFMEVSTSNVPPLPKTEPAISVSPDAPSLKQVGGVVNVASLSSQPKSTSQTHTDTSEDPLAPLESEVPAGETTETKAVTETFHLPVLPKPEYTVDKKVETSSVHASTVEPVILTTLESQVDASPGSVETIVITASVVEGPADPTEDAAVQSKSVDSEVVDVFHTTKELPALETATESTVESGTSALNTEAVLAEGAVGMIAEAEAVAEVAQTNSTDSGVVDKSNIAKEEPLIETINSSGETRASLLESEAEVEGEVEHPTETVSDRAAENNTNAQESAVVPLKNESTLESTVETSSGNVTVEDGVSDVEGISIESVMMESLKIDEFLQAKFVLDEEAEKELQDILGQTESETEFQTKNEKPPEFEGETLTEVLSKWDSLSEDLQDLEGETRMLEKQFLCHVPVSVSGVKTSSVSDPPLEDVLQMEEKAAEAESMTLESVILAEVKAEVECIETEVLRETWTALEKEEETVAKEEEMEVKTAAADAPVPDEVNLDFLSEATDALKAEVSHILEAVICSEQGPRQLPNSLFVDQKLGPWDEEISQEIEKDSGEDEGSIVELLTVAESEALLRTLESRYFGETAGCLEKAADVLATEKKMEVEDAAAPEGMAEALKVETQVNAEALSEAPQSDALMEELLCSVSGSAAEIAKDPVSGNVTTATATVDKVATVIDDVPDPPALDQIALELEEVKEEAVQTEALEIQKDLDPVQRLFLEKIKEYNNMCSGGPAAKEPDYERRLSEETAKLQRLYGGGDLSSFPQFTFTEPKMDQDNK